jgi:hypothetical protein
VKVERYFVDIKLFAMYSGSFEFVPLSNKQKVRHLSRKQTMWNNRANSPVECKNILILKRKKRYFGLLFTFRKI